MSPENKLILSCVKVSPDQFELDTINELIPLVQDWDYFSKTIFERGIAPLLYQKLPLLPNRIFLPTNIQSNLQQAYYKTLSRNMIFYNHFREIAQAFNVCSVQLIALKGIYLSDWLYKDIALRQMSDIDILVRPGDGVKAIAILSDLGYKTIEEESVLSNKLEVVHYSPMVLDGVAIEVHIKLHQDNERYHILVEELWKNATPYILEKQTISVLDINDLLIHTCLHLDRHFNQGHVQFTCFTDVTNILEKVGRDFDWKGFVDRCKLYNCEKEVFKYIVLANKYMAAGVPGDVVKIYVHTLTKVDEQLFIKYLGGYVGFTTGMHRHFGNFWHIDSFSDKLKYLWEITFPTKKFMLDKFDIKDSRLVYFYYPYRYFLGLKGVILLAKKRLFN